MRATEGIHSAAGVFGDGALLNVNAMRPFMDDDGQPKVVSNGQKLKTNAPALLRYDEWKDIDRNVHAVATQRLVGIADLISKGLTHPLGSIGVTIALWQRSSDMTPANVDMSGVTEGEEDRPAFDTQQVPVPIVHKDFRVNLRNLEASRRMGQGVDLVASDIAARVVAEKSEDMLFDGAPIVVEGSSIVGYRTHPDRNTVGPVESWNGSPAQVPGSQIVANVQAMLQAARTDNMHGPFILYIPTKYEGRMSDDYNPGTSDTRTIRERIMALGQISEIKVADRLAPGATQTVADHSVLLVQMTRDVVDLAIAQDVTTVSWQMYGGMQERFKVMACWVPRIKSDFDGRSGIVHLDTSTTPA